jgi:3-hydroxyacyl-[acyl-carrier-protein] dehydratase
MTIAEIISFLPYSAPFHFVDELIEVTEEAVIGSHRFSNNDYFYQGHFKDKPVTPGVILTEVMAQIGVVCLGIYLMRDTINQGDIQVAMTSSEIDFFLPVYPGEEVQVTSRKEYFRFNKLKCAVELRNEKNQLVCRGNIAGMFAHGK